MKHLVDYDEFQIWSNKEKKIKKKKKKKFPVVPRGTTVTCKGIPL